MALGISSSVTTPYTTYTWTKLIWCFLGLLFAYYYRVKREKLPFVVQNRPMVKKCSVCWCYITELLYIWESVKIKYIWIFKSWLILGKRFFINGWGAFFSLPTHSHNIADMLWSRISIKRGEMSSRRCITIKSYWTTHNNLGFSSFYLTPINEMELVGYVAIGCTCLSKNGVTNGV